MTARRALLDRAGDLNRATAGNWDLFAGHRARLTSIIGASCGAGVQRLTIVGAGNCNDIDLGMLLGCAATIQLVDLDGRALEAALTRQGLADCARIETHAGVDVTGAASSLDRWTKDRASHTQIDRSEKQLAHTAHLPPLAGCDVIVSACLLSQLILALVDALGAEHRRLPGLVQRVRDQHLMFLSAHLRTGGRALLASDFASSDTCPALLDAPDEAIELLATAALHDRNFFSGTNPLAIVERLKTLAGPAVEDIHLLRPWRWRIGPARAYLVYALTFRTGAGRHARRDSV